MIVSNVRKHLAAIANVTKDYAEATRLTVKFLLAENY